MLSSSRDYGESLTEALNAPSPAKVPLAGPDPSWRYRHQILTYFLTRFSPTNLHRCIDSPPSPSSPAPLTSPTPASFLALLRQYPLLLHQKILNDRYINHIPSVPGEDARK